MGPSGGGLSERDFLRQVQALVRAQVGVWGTTDIHEVCELTNDFLCSYASAMDMPMIYVAYVSSPSAIEIDVLGPHSVLARKPKKV